MKKVQIKLLFWKSQQLKSLGIVEINRRSNHAKYFEMPQSLIEGTINPSIPWTIFRFILVSILTFIYVDSHQMA